MRSHVSLADQEHLQFLINVTRGVVNVMKTVPQGLDRRTIFTAVVPSTTATATASVSSSCSATRLSRCYIRSVALGGAWKRLVNHLCRCLWLLVRVLVVVIACGVQQDC